ncbi:hypothetical protein JTB14_008988 [Gonioctena quinquepunctata]|nr:hypothetical protein JTB14_008988 [Gonioctena quinquepunctata]
MEVYRRSSGLLLLLGLSLLATTLQGVQGEVELEGPSESECRPYIEKALKELETGEPVTGSSENADSEEGIPTVEITSDDFDHQDGDGEDIENNEEGPQSTEEVEDVSEPSEPQEDAASQEEQDQPSVEADETENPENESNEEVIENNAENKIEEETEEAQAEISNDEDSTEKIESAEETQEEIPEKEDESDDEEKQDLNEQENENKEQDTTEETKETEKEDVESEDQEQDEEEQAENQNTSEEEAKTDDQTGSEEQDQSGEDKENIDDTLQTQTDSTEDQTETDEERNENEEGSENNKLTKDESEENQSTESQNAPESAENEKENDAKRDGEDENDQDTGEEETKSTEDTSEKDETEVRDGDKEDNEEENGSDEKEVDNENEESDSPMEDLSLDIEIPSELRVRDHVEQLLKIDDDSSGTQDIINKVSVITLKSLKKLYENAIKPLEVLYKYRELSNRHFGDAEIFSKPLILFMGPWSGGKSSIINYLVNNEYNETSLRTGAEPSPAYFNILMHGDEPEIVDGTELAADFTFSGLQKFGQGLEERLQGVKLPTKLLEKVNIVEIPGILEVRKQVSRVFPFNDACQWFIDRADIIFLVYDPSKLDVGPETEAILDQLKGREHQTRIILNKADQVKPEELFRVQGALIWNISPLMSSPQPPVMYTVSLWSKPYEPWAPTRLLQAQERSFLRDLRGAIDKRIENKIASARRFAVRVRNHAKMVDCYLTTYFNHKSVFGNRKQVADEIIEHPQDYHIYEGLSTLTNISRYDLPDPDVYRDFFKLNPLYEFQPLSATCTYFRGCPINRLDVAIAYDLPELVGTHKKLIENALADTKNQSTAAPGS